MQTTGFSREMPLPGLPWQWKSHQKCLGMPVFKHHLNGLVKSSNTVKLDVTKCRLGHWRVHIPNTDPCQVTQHYTSSKVLHALSFLKCSFCTNKSKGSQTLLQYQFSCHFTTTHPGSTISSCKQEFKSSNHQVCESQPLEHPWNTQIIPGHWKTCKQCERGADIGCVVNTKVTLLQGELRSTAPVGMRNTSTLSSQFSVHHNTGKVTRTINSGWHKSLTERIPSVQNWTALHKIPSNCWHSFCNSPAKEAGTSYRKVRKRLSSTHTVQGSNWDSQLWFPAGLAQNSSRGFF